MVNTFILREDKRMKVYKYNRCGSCRKAVKFLKDNNVNFQELEILETPPSKEELKEMLGYLDGNIKKLFNTSGVKYREGNYKDIIKIITEDEALNILSKDGALIKRPFILADGKGTVGYKEEVLKDFL